MTDRTLHSVLLPLIRSVTPVSEDLTEGPSYVYGDSELSDRLDDLFRGSEPAPEFTPRKVNAR